MPTTAPTDLRILPLARERQADFLRFFEGPAFADNPKWSSCYCQFLHVDHRCTDWQARTAAENRAAACDRIASGRMRGHLALRGGEVVGWCNAEPRTMLEAFLDEPDPEAERLGQITCFVVAPAHRRTGVATALLAAACTGLREQGMAIAEASPKAEGTGDAENHYGPLALYLAAGFTVLRPAEHGRLIVRKSLSGP